MGESMKSPFGMPSLPSGKKINWLLYFWINIVDLMLVPFRFGLQEPPPPPFNTSAFYQHVGISPGILGPHGHLTSNTWFCCQLQQGMAKGTMTCRDSAWGKCQKHQTQFTYRSLRGFRQWIRVYHWYLLMITIGLWRISSNLSNSIHHSLLPWSSTKIFCYLLAYISIYIYRKYIYIYVDS